MDSKQCGLNCTDNTIENVDEDSMHSAKLTMLQRNQSDSLISFEMLCTVVTMCLDTFEMMGWPAMKRVTFGTGDPAATHNTVTEEPSRMSRLGFRVGPWNTKFRVTCFKTVLLN